jgi:hypothetical protein
MLQSKERHEMKTRLAWTLVLVTGMAISIARAASVHGWPERQHKIAPDHLARGISKGLVIAYGHPIKPPFKIELRSDGKIYANGVQVIPSIVNEREAAQEQPKLSPSDTAITESLWKTTHEAQAKARAGTPPAEVLEFVRQQPNVKTATLSSSTIKLVMSNGLPMILELPAAGAVPISGTEINKRSTAHLRSRVSEIERKLKQGYVVIFVDSGTSELPTIPRLSDIRAIMEDPATSDQEKVRRLSSHFVEPVAKDIVTNYSHEEWLEK